MATHDLARIGHFDEQTVLSLLQTRYDANEIYTNVNQMMLAFNPYVELGLYAPAVRRLYGGYGGGSAEPPPHVFGVAAEAFKGMLDGQSQCILVTGESGAGKTESCRRVLQYLASVGLKAVVPGDDGDAAAGREDDGASALHRQVTDTNCVLEAFGNARTVMNDNSSRFGKFLAIQYDETAALLGASVTTYLLEKTRVVSHAAGERAFHIFYSLLDAAVPPDAQTPDGQPPRIAGSLRLTSSAPSSYRYTAETALPAAAMSTPRRSVTRRASLVSPGGQGMSAHSLGAVQAALTQVGMAASSQQHVWQIVAAVLHLGNLEFVSVDESSGDASELDQATEGALLAASELLGLQMSALRHALVTRCIKAGAEFISTPNSAAQAVELRDGLSKALYARVFSWLIGSINMSFARPGEAVLPDDEQAVDGGSALELGVAGRRIIGLLDIFGFEIFERNSLEQLLINYTNEQLQSIFNEIIFTAAQAHAPAHTAHTAHTAQRGPLSSRLPFAPVPFQRRTSPRLSLPGGLPHLIT